MFIHSKERLEVLLEARNEFSEFQSAVPTTGFYEEKIAAAWRRALASPAYRGIGGYSPEAFDSLPVTPKERLKSEPWNFTAVPLGACVRYHETTGTTGGATPTPRTAEDVVWNTVSVAHAWGDVLEHGDRVLNLLPSDIVPVGDLVASVCEYLDLPYTRAYPFTTGITGWDRVIGLWRELRPTVLLVAPGVALQLTRLLKQRGLLEELRASVRSLMLLGEVSVPAMRRRLGDWWGATAYDASYGSTETGTLAAACGRDRLHMLTAANYAEVATEGAVEPLAPGSRGRLVVTPLNLYARPLLRYDTGDRVEIEQGCSCGRATPVLRVLGRATDTISVHGTVLSPRAVEEIVYEAAPVTGYLLETAEEGSWARLLLERLPGADRSEEPRYTHAVQALSRERSGLTWDRVAFVNSLPTNTKSGGSQKSWKRSNIRVVEAR